MNKSERQVVLFLTNHFGVMSGHLFGLFEELKKSNANEEQAWAYLRDISNSRNTMVEGFRMFESDINKAIKEIMPAKKKKTLCKKIS